MVNIVFVGLCDLRTFFRTYEHFTSVLGEDFYLLRMFISLYGTAPSYPTITTFSTVGFFFISINLRENLTLFAKSNVLFEKKKTF